MLTRLARNILAGAACAWLWISTTEGRTIRAVGELQAALDAARPGDVILLDPGASYVGNFVLPAKEGDGVITLQTAVDSERVSTPAGRIEPDQAMLLAKIRTPNGSPALRTAPGAHHWRLTLLEIHGGGGADLIRLGDGGQAQSRADQVPQDLVIDRCYIHGDRRGGQKRGIALNSARTTIVNSHISDIAADAQESQAIAGWNGPGPFTIENNYLEAASVNVMFGGGDPAIRGLVPSDITVRRNRFAKRLQWREDGRWAVKNLLELKNARRVVVEWNLFEYNWLEGQTGSAILIKSVNQDGNAPWSVVEDVTIRHNLIRHVGSGFNIQGRSANPPSGLTRGIRIANNLAYDVSAARWGGHGRFLLVGDGAEDLTIDHNSVFQDGAFVQAYGASGGAPQPMRGARVTNNLALHNDYGIKGDGRAVGSDTITAFFPDGVFQRNVLAGGSGQRYPAANEFPDVNDFLAEFVDAGAQDYRLKPDSRYRRGATDGGALGADVELLLRCIGAPLLPARRHPRPSDCPATVRTVR